MWAGEASCMLVMKLHSIIIDSMHFFYLHAAETVISKEGSYSKNVKFVASSKISVLC